MICLICRQAEIVEGLTSVNFQRGEMYLIVNHVPARVCPGCGEAYIGEEVAVRLLRYAEKISKLGELESISEYDSSC